MGLCTKHIRGDRQMARLAHHHGSSLLCRLCDIWPLGVSAHCPSNSSVHSSRDPTVHPLADGLPVLFPHQRRYSEIVCSYFEQEQASWEAKPSGSMSTTRHLWAARAIGKKDDETRSACARISPCSLTLRAASAIQRPARKSESSFSGITRIPRTNVWAAGMKGLLPQSCVSTSIGLRSCLMQHRNRSMCGSGGSIGDQVLREEGRCRLRCPPVQHG